MLFAAVRGHAYYAGIFAKLTRPAHDLHRFSHCDRQQDAAIGLFFQALAFMPLTFADVGNGLASEVNGYGPGCFAKERQKGVFLLLAKTIIGMRICG